MSAYHQINRLNRDQTALTPRQLEVLQAIAQYQDDRKRIMEALCVSKTTLAAHINAIYEKLSVHTAVGAVIEGMKRDYIPLP